MKRKYPYVNQTGWQIVGFFNKKLVPVNSKIYKNKPLKIRDKKSKELKKPLFISSYHKKGTTIRMR